jgi:hypothetical protein
MALGAILFLAMTGLLLGRSLVVPFFVHLVVACARDETSKVRFQHEAVMGPVWTIENISILNFPIHAQNSGARFDRVENWFGNNILRGGAVAVTSIFGIKTAGWLGIALSSG